MRRIALVALALLASACFGTPTEPRQTCSDYRAIPDSTSPRQDTLTLKVCVSFPLSNPLAPVIKQTKRP